MFTMIKENVTSSAPKSDSLYTRSLGLYKHQLWSPSLQISSLLCIFSSVFVNKQTATTTKTEKTPFHQVRGKKKKGLFLGLFFFFLSLDQIF